MADGVAGNVKVILAADASSYSQALDLARKKLAELQGAADRAGMTTRRTMTEAKGSIALLGDEIGVAMPRHLRTFVAQLPGVAAAMSAAFDAVAVIALIDFVVKAGEKVTEFFTKTDEGARQAQEGWRNLGSSMQKTNDELRLTNDRLHNQLAVLEGRPQNNLAVAIDEARVAANKLAESVQADIDKVAQLLQQQQVGGFFGGLTSGQYRTAGTEGSIGYWNNRLADQSYAYNEAVHQHGDQSQEAKDALATLDAVRQLAQQWTAQRITEVSSWPDQKGAAANLSELHGEQNMLNAQQDSQNLQLDNARTQGQIAKDEAAKKAHEEAKQRAEQVKQQQEQIFQAWQQGLNRAKALWGYSANDEANYWLTMANTARTGSLSYTRAIGEANKAMGAQQAERIRLDEQTDKELAALADDITGRADLEKDQESTKYIQAQSKATVEWLHNLSEAPEIQRKNAEALEGQNIQMGEATGALSRMDAAQLLAKLHTQQYSEAVFALLDALDAVAHDPTLSDMERRAQTTALQNQLAALGGARDLQTGVDAQASRGGMDRLVDSMAKLGEQFADFTAKLPGIFEGFVDGINDNAAKWMTGQNTNWSGTFQRTGEELAKAGLQKAESALGIFPKQQHVWVDNMPGGGANGQQGGIFGGVAGKAIGWLGKLFHPGGGLGSVTDGTADPLGLNVPGVDTSGWADSMGDGAIPAFAGGGDPTAGRPALVGENGPELFVPRTAGTIVPNHKLGGSASYYIDASGANAADVEMRVQRALVAVHGSAVRQSVAAQRELSRRRPSGPRARF